MFSSRPLQIVAREQAIIKIRQDLISICTNSQLKGWVNLLNSNYEGSDSEAFEINFAILYKQKSQSGVKVSQGTLYIRYDPLFPQQGPVCIEVETGSGSTYRLREIWPLVDQQDNFNMEKTLIAILSDLSSAQKDLQLSIMSANKVNLPLTNENNKNQSFIVSQNSCFSRIAHLNKSEDPSFRRTEEKKKSKDPSFRRTEEQKDSNSTYFKRRRNSRPMKKNANLPKFLIRIFIKYLQKFKRAYPKKQFDRLYNDCRKMKEWKRTENKQHALGLKHLKQLFQEEKSGYPNPEINRKVVRKIISQFLLQEICENSQIPETHRLGYLVACRVYALRCRNSSLAGRIQSK